MKQPLCRSLIGLYIWKIYSVAEVLFVQFPLCASVSPNSPVEVIPLPCSLNKYLTIDQNGKSKCSRCSVCPKGFQVQTECSISNDTVCEPCPTGWYNDVSGSRCKPCSGCKQGEYIRRDCSVKRDTSCRHCPRETFSVNVNVSMCLPCRRCKQNEKTISKCEARKDTKCGDCQNGYFRVSSTRSCLPCSHCPAILKHRVVPECRDKLGIHHPDICWPSDTQYRFTNFGITASSKDGATSGNIQIIQEESGGDLPVVFFVTIFGSILCCIVIIIIVFICLRLLPYRQHFNMSQALAADIPMLPISASTRYNYETNHDSLTTANDGTDSECSDPRTKTNSRFQERTVCFEHGNTSSEISLILTDPSVCSLCEDRYYCRNVGCARADSVPVFTTTNMLTSSTRSLQEKSETCFDEPTESPHSKPWYSEHRIYRTI